MDNGNLNELAPASIRLTLRDGRRIERTCSALPGSAARPLSFEAWQDKGRACLQAGAVQMDAHEFSQAVARWCAATTVQPFWNP
ncbi:hypothetical protein D3C81_1773910 [compost metagenome]